MTVMASIYDQVEEWLAHDLMNKLIAHVYFANLKHKNLTNPLSTHCIETDYS